MIRTQAAIERAGMIDRAHKELEDALEHAQKAARILSSDLGGNNYYLHAKLVTAIRSLTGVLKETARL